MSRGFDSFEIDDSRGWDSGSGRDVGRSSSSSLKTRIELQNIHREEERADKLDREGRDRSDQERPPHLSLFRGQALAATKRMKVEQYAAHCQRID
jgi:hypothetical protein